MYIVTGGAGFIGSNLVISLLEKGCKDIAVCDTLGIGDKWLNLRKHPVSYFVHPEDMMPFLARHAEKIDAVFHMAATSSTTEMNADQLIANNYNFSCQLWEWCAEHGTRFVYASSVATYGHGEQGFQDDQSSAYLEKLRPLNPYGWSKHLFDVKVARDVEAGKPTPPQWAGLKMFNVYGPNEYHKDQQQSVLSQKFPRASANLKIPLFKSEHPDYAHGEQKRDFVYVEDCCEVMLWLLDHPEVSGLFNVGTGKAVTFHQMADILCQSLGREEAQIDYVDLPPELSGKYQYFTEADLTKLRQAGYQAPFKTLEEGVRHYATRYLTQDDLYR